MVSFLRKKKVQGKLSRTSMHFTAHRALIRALPVNIVLHFRYDARQSDDEYSDDDDMSWKVRRASAKCLDAIIATRHELLSDFYTSVSPALIARFKGQSGRVKDTCGGQRSR